MPYPALQEKKILRNRIKNRLLKDIEQIAAQKIPTIFQKNCLTNLKFRQPLVRSTHSITIINFIKHIFKNVQHLQVL